MSWRKVCSKIRKGVLHIELLSFKRQMETKKKANGKSKAENYNN